jgi:prepilin-type N-terminal cleavage/methylation domain-containing protein/prepilin-type processing-associated H-X9-DG protein
MRRRGFTLIELLVVIAIIAILAAILFPVFAQAREKARAITCVSNLKQFGLAFAQYNQDYDEHMPSGFIKEDGTPDGWACQVYPYLKSDAVYICPDDSGAKSGNGSSYGLNANLGGNQTGTQGTQFTITLPQFVQPARTVMLFELANSNGFDPSISPSNYTQAGSDWQGPVGNAYNEAKSSAGFGTGGYTGGDTYDPSGNNAQDGTAGTFGANCNSKNCYATGVMLDWMPGKGGHNFTAVLGRHNGGSNFLMCDTHAKFLAGTHVAAGYPTDPGGYSSWDSSHTYCGAADDTTQTYPVAADVGCTDPKIGATFSWK